MEMPRTLKDLANAASREKQYAYYKFVFVDEVGLPENSVGLQYEG